MNRIYTKNQRSHKAYTNHKPYHKSFDTSSVFHRQKKTTNAFTVNVWSNIDADVKKKLPGKQKH